MLVRARHYATGETIDVRHEGGVIRQVCTAGSQAPDQAADWIAPAWFDVQINGAAGIAFSSESLTIDQVGQVVEVCQSHGIGAFCPTLVTNSFAALQHGLKTLAAACDQDRRLARALPCFHLEGPYLSAEDGPRGAHPRAHIRPPDLDEFGRLQEAAAGKIRLVTLAPELPGAMALIEKLAASGVVVAIGHTAASPEQIRLAAAHARLSTHLGNGTHAMLPRHENYLWEQLADDRLWASIICDGAHLPPALVRCFLRVKTPARTLLTCDASPLAGLPPGIYREWDQEFEVTADGKILLRGTSFLGGSGSFTDRCIANVMRFAGVSLRDAVDMASARPRQLLGLPVAALEAALPTPLVLFDWQPGGDVRVRRLLA